MKIVMWELSTVGDRCARCVHQHDTPVDHVGTVVLSEIERFHEDLATESDAHDEAEHLLAHFMLDGWTTVLYRDPRIPLP